MSPLWFYSIIQKILLTMEVIKLCDKMQNELARETLAEVSLSYNLAKTVWDPPSQAPIVHTFNDVNIYTFNESIYHK